MADPRFYTPQARFEIGGKALLTEQARHHAGRVLRMKAGDRAVLFDGDGMQAAGPIHFEGKDAWIVVQSVCRPEVESPVAVTLVQALVSPEKMDWIIEKAVETGVSRIVVVPAKRSMTKLAGERLQKRLQHWESVAVSACAQSGRTRVPEISFMSFDKALRLQADARILLAPSASTPPKARGLSSCLLAVGPEGGFDDEEIQAALDNGWQCALIGPRVLRTETAGIVAVTLINAASGDYRLG